MEINQNGRACAFAPATVANVACAFDVLGFAVSSPGDRVIARVSDSAGVRIVKIEGDGGKLPLESNKNTASVAVSALLNQLGISLGIELEIKKAMPLGSGLGSSAASAAAALVAVNNMMGSPLSRQELVPLAMKGEQVACGAAHADNVAPALLGGFVLIRSYTPLDIVRITSPADLHCAVVHPQIEIRTADARKILRKDVQLAKVIVQLGNTAGLIAGLLQSDYELIGRSLTDVLIEPERSLLIPGFTTVKTAALENGALGCSISGSGPAMFSLAASSIDAQRCGEAMQAAFGSMGIESQKYVSKINADGATVVDLDS
jgi:homoserine kinase